jgi:hypothetical protein
MGGIDAVVAPRQPMLSPLELEHHPYFTQKISVSEELVGRDRIDVFAQLCTGKRVLHVGCVDWPITDLRNSLHLQLDKICNVDGFDIHDEAFAQMQPHLHGRLYSRWEEVPGGYDLVLVPEVLEHVPDIRDFFARLDAVGAPEYIITVPDAYSCMRRHFDYNAGAQTFIEAVHPDHNCWYTPYTLANVLRKYTPWQLQGLWFFNRMSLLAIATRADASRR